MKFDPARLLLDERPPVVRWVLALVLFVLAVAARFWVDPVLPSGFPYLTFFPAVILATFVCGLWPGVAVAIASFLSSWYFFIPPLDSFALDTNSLIALAFFAFIVAVDIVIIHGMKVAVHRFEEERKRSDRLAKLSETMFSELQHRISNNLQVVSAMLRIQRGRVADPDAKRALDESIGRLNLIARLHRRMHDPSGDQLTIDVFLDEVCKEMVAASAVDQTITCVVEAPAIRLEPRHALPLGLIAGEFVANAVEHGYGPGRDGLVTVRATQLSGQRLELAVSDAGEGLPEGFDIAAVQSIGLKVSQQLATQFAGAIELWRDTAAGLTYSRVIFRLAEDVPSS